MRAKTMLRASLAGLFALAACEQSGTGSSPADLSRDDATALAPVYADLAEAELATFGAPSFDSRPQGPSMDMTGTTEFTRTRTCPVSGSVRVDGKIVHTVDMTTRSGSMRYDATRTEQACTFNLRSGGTLTVNGDPNTVVTGSWSMTNGVPGIRTVTQKGAFTWTKSAGGSGSCTLDVTATFDPATHTAHIQGTFCGRTIDVTRTRSY